MVAPAAPEHTAERGPATAGSRLPAALTWAAVAFAAWLLWVPRSEVVLMHDMLGYAAQGRSLLHGDGNVVLLDGQPIPGYYPAGLPLAIAAAYAVLGADLRNGQVVVWVADLAVLLLAAWLARRLAGPWAGPMAVLLLLASAGFRDVATLTLSQTPTAALMLGSAALFLAPGAGLALFLSGLLASSTLLLRFANVSFPAALGLAGLLAWRARGVPPWRTVLVLGAGLAVGGALVAAHNAWAYGSPLGTGYAAWGHEVQGQFSPRNILDPVMIGNRGDESLMLRSVLGLGELYAVPVLLAAVWGAIVLLRAGGERRVFALLAVTAVVAQDLFLACYAFRSEAYLVPALPLVVLVAAAGALDAAGRVLRRGAEPAAALGAVALLAASLLQRDEPTMAEREARARYASLARAGLELEEDAALVTPSDFALVEPLVRTPGRRILYSGPFVADVVEDAAMRELGGGKWRPPRAVPWVAERLAEGRPVYVDQNPPPRGVVPMHRQLREELRDAFRLVPTPIEGLYRVERKT